MEQNKVKKPRRHEIGFSRQFKIMSRATNGGRREWGCLCKGQGVRKTALVQGKSGQGTFHLLEEASDGNDRTNVVKISRVPAGQNFDQSRGKHREGNWALLWSTDHE